MADEKPKDNSDKTISNLYNKLQQKFDQNKFSIGYTVKNYSVSALKQNQEQVEQGESSPLINDVVTNLGNLQFDENGFTKDATWAVWRMYTRLADGLPLRNKGSKYTHIATFQGTNYNTNDWGDVFRPPKPLKQDAVREYQNSKKFDVGVFISQTKAVQYFNKMYVSTADSKIELTHIAKLIENKCLFAEIITGTSSRVIKVIGFTPAAWDGDGSGLYICPELFTLNQLKSIKIKLEINDVDKLLDQNCDYEFPINDGFYNQDDASMENYDVKAYKNWASTNASNSGSANDSIKLKQFNETIPIYVKLFIKEENRGKAMAALGNIKVNQRLFQMVGANNNKWNGYIRGDFSVKTQDLLKILGNICNNHNLKLITQQQIKRSAMKRGGGAQFGTGTSKTGKFKIPAGWPMFVTRQYKNADSSFYTSRFDSELTAIDDKNKNSRILRGEMSNEWYAERIRKANSGDAYVYCQGRGTIANKITRTFEQSFAIYSEVANQYNAQTGNTITPAQVILRVAPTLCCITSVARGAGNRGYHPHGQAIDFCYHENYCAPGGNPSGRHLSDNADQGYRPFLHYAYENGGRWGGASSTFFKKSMYDAMHFDWG